MIPSDTGALKSALAEQQPKKSLIFDLRDFLFVPLLPLFGKHGSHLEIPIIRVLSTGQDFQIIIRKVSKSGNLFHW